jgi:anti-sigma B factor antagonist
MKYRLDKQASYAVLTLDEENLNSSLAPQFKSDLIILSNEGLPGLILDLSNVKFVDSSGLSAILTGHRLWKENGTFFVAGELQPMVKKLIEISRLDSIIRITSTVNEAIEMLRALPEEMH